MRHSYFAPEPALVWTRQLHNIERPSFPGMSLYLGE